MREIPAIVSRPISQRITFGPITELLISRVYKPCDNKRDERLNIEVIADALIQKAQAGDLTAVQMIFEYIQGKPSQTVTYHQIAWAMQSLTREELASIFNLTVEQMHEAELNYARLVNAAPTVDITDKED